MISMICKAINNHFVKTVEFVATIETDGATGLFAETYPAGSYIYIKGSRMNDGVYPILGATSSKITVDAELLAENTGDTIYVFGCAMPKDFIDLVNEITAWNTNNAGKDGIAQETVSRYSVSFRNGGGWSAVFAQKLNEYRCVYDEADNILIRANCGRCW